MVKKILNTVLCFLGKHKGYREHYYNTGDHVIKTLYCVSCGYIKKVDTKCLNK